MNHEWIKQLILDYPNYILYWEWLQKHTIEYNKEAYHHFYLFDIIDLWYYLPPCLTKDIAELNNIKHPELLYSWMLKEEDIQKYLSQSALWPKSEWVVIKSTEYVNEYWRKPYAKVVNEEFAETKWVKKHKYTLWDIEVWIAEEVITLARVQKIILKIEDIQWESISAKNVWEIMWRVYHDVIEEEMWDILNKFNSPKIDFRQLNKTITLRVKKYLMDLWIL